MLWRMNLFKVFRTFYFILKSISHAHFPANKEDRLKIVLFCRHSNTSVTFYIPKYLQAEIPALRNRFQRQKPDRFCFTVFQDENVSHRYADVLGELGDSRKIRSNIAPAVASTIESKVMRTPMKIPPAGSSPPWLKRNRPYIDKRKERILEVYFKIRGVCIHALNLRFPQQESESYTSSIFSRSNWACYSLCMRKTHSVCLCVSLLLIFGAGCTTQEKSASPSTAKSSPPSSTSTIDQRIVTPPSAKITFEGCPPYSEIVSSTDSNPSSCFFHINQKLPIYEFRLHAAPFAPKEKIVLINRIDVVPVGATTATQVLIVDSGESPMSDTDRSYVSVEDLNFDGYNDLKVLRSQGATGNTTYTVWMFDPKTSQFILNKQLSNLMNPTPNPKTETLTSFSNSSAADWGHQTYVWKNGQLMLIHEVIQNFEHVSETVSCTINEYINGRKVKTTRVEKECLESGD